MAFTADDTDQNPNDPNFQQNQQQAAAQRQIDSNPATGGGSALFGSTPGGGGPSNANPAPKENSSGGNWVGIDQYLAANKDQAAGMGNQLATSVGNQAQGASNAVNSLNQDFSNQVQQGTTNFDPTAVNTAVSDAMNLKSGQTLNDADINNFQTQAGANYTGPTDLTQDRQYDSTNSAVSKAQGALNSAQSDAGRQDLLNQTYGGNGLGYTNGDKALDSALVEASPDAQKSISGVEDQWRGLSGMLGQASENARTQAQQARQTDQQTAAQAAQALGTYGTDINGVVSGNTGAAGQWAAGLFGQSDAASSAYTKALSDLNNSARNGQLTTAQLGALGLDPSMRNYGVQLNSNYIQPGTAPTLASAATADQYAQQAALAKLSGLLPNGAAAGAPILNAANLAQASTAAGVNGNAMAQVSPTFQNDVQAAQAGIPNQIARALDDYITANNIGLGGVQVNSFDPATDTATVQGVGEGGSSNPFNVSLDPYSQYAASKPTAFTGQGISNVYNGLGQYGEWQNLVNMAGSTLNGSEAFVNPFGPHFGGRPAIMAQGGMVPSMPSVNKVLSEKVAAPVKEPKIPKIPRPDSKLPTMPRFAEGGDVLDSNARSHIASKNFAEPGARKYPIHDIEHARNALSRVSQFGSDSEKAAVRRQVHAKYPSLAKAAGGEVPASPSAYAGDALKAGGVVPGTPKVDHNSYSNDSVEARLSPKEVVLPLSVTQSRDPVKAAADFMASVLLKKDRK